MPLARFSQSFYAKTTVDRDPDQAGVDTAAAIRRMKDARSRAVKGGGVKEVKTLAALQQEIKVIKRTNTGIFFILFFRRTVVPALRIPKLVKLPRLRAHLFSQAWCHRIRGGKDLKNNSPA